MQVITDTHLLLGALIILIPDLIVYAVFVPLDIALPDIGTVQNKEEPFVVNVSQAPNEQLSLLVCPPLVYVMCSCHGSVGCLGRISISLLVTGTI